MRKTLNKSTYDKINLKFVKDKLLSSILSNGDWKIFTVVLVNYGVVSK